MSPVYDNTPLAVIQQLIPGVPGYAFGSRAPGPTCKMLITADSVDGSDNVTLYVIVTEGNIPLVGDLIYTYATGNSAGALNQTTGLAISAVAINPATGVGTVIFPLTTAMQSKTADTGYALSTPQEIPEVTAKVASKAFAIQNTIGRGYGLSWAYYTPSAPSTIGIQLEGAISNSASEFTIIGASKSVTNAWTEVFATLPELVNFVRLNITILTGGPGTIIGKILLS